MQAFRGAAALAALWSAGVCSGASARFVVVVLDYAETPVAALREAASAAHDAYSEAGIPTEWLVCQVSRNPNASCTFPQGGDFAQVKVLPPALEGRMQQREGLGYAIGCPPAERCSTSYAFLRPVAALAASASRPLGLVLGYVMAHEVGHLLGISHGASGIMKPGFDCRDMRDASSGRLQFGRNEAAALHDAISLRAESAAAALADFQLAQSRTR